MEQQAVTQQALQGKKVVILGGSTGIGLATAIASAQSGALVLIVSSNAERIRKALQHLPAGSVGLVADLRNEAQVRDVFEKTGSIDHLVYTAGEGIRLGMIADTALEEARAYFDLRYWGAFAAVKYAASKILQGGSITLTGGIASQRPGPGWSLGASICAAMEGFTRAMAVELAPLRVNLVSPGIVRTGLWSGLPESDREGLYHSAASKQPLRKVGDADDIAQAYLYLMQQTYATGQVLVVDGGAVLV
jgi:NAD(P)-dependent dehydrogenase (short-subunit alcohol dehydrogenase family)